MGLRIATNISSLTAQRSLATSQKDMAKSMAQLSSGSRITKAADDAAGLAISENLRSDLRGLQQASRNANDAVSMVQVAEGGLNEIGNIVMRFRELGVQAASDTVSDTERAFIDKEVQQLKQEADRIANSTRFGKVSLLNGESGGFDFQVGINNSENDKISYDASKQVATLDALKLDSISFENKEGARSALEKLDGAQQTLNGHRATLGAMQNRLASTTENLGVAVENMSAANSRIRDTDVAASTAEQTRNQILLSASTSVLSQANQAPMAAMKLIG